MWYNAIKIPLTLFCTLTSICLQSNSRLTTSKCPFDNAKVSAVSPFYIFFLSSSTKFWLKNTPYKNREENLEIENLEMVSNTISIPLTLLCTLTSICLQSNSWLTTSKYPCSEAQIRAVSSCYIFFVIKCFSLKNTLKHNREENLKMWCNAISIPLTLFCTLIPVCLQSSSRLTTFKCPSAEA